MPKPFLAASAVATVLLLDVADAFGAGTGENTPVNLDEGKKPSGDVPGASTGGSIARTIVGLAIVIGVIYGLYWVLKQLKASREEKASGQGLSAIATLPLGPNRSMHLVRAGSEVLVIGVTEQGVTPIRTYSEREAMEQGLFDVEGDAVEQPAKTLALPNALAAVNGRTAIEAIRGWTVRG